MSTPAIPEPNPSDVRVAIPAGASSALASPAVFRNSRIVCWLMMGIGVCSVFLGLCMVLMAGSLLFPVSSISIMRVLAAAQWGLGGVAMVYMCPALWKWSATMAFKRVKLDERGADFQLGTRKSPQQVFIPWSELTSVTQKRIGATRQFTFTGSDGSYAQFSSSTFFRAGRIALTIAERAGITLQQI